ncbi:secreted protein [gut metagenome]|uniref:Secreted protein n=1 Tax=gut metagenome TaxID=749906 RepID=J9GHK9_9ZZZZ
MNPFLAFSIALATLLSGLPSSSSNKASFSFDKEMLSRSIRRKCTQQHWC